MEATPRLKAALYDLYWREDCDQKGWAYVALKDIGVRDNIIVFSRGSGRINARLMDKIVPEIKEISAPAKGGFVFDYLAYNPGQHSGGTVLANPAAMCWVKIGRRAFSDGQIDALGRIKIPLAIFRIRDVLARPAKVEAKWEIKSGEEWLDELDDIRDQAESDDDYF